MIGTMTTNALNAEGTKVEGVSGEQISFVACRGASGSPLSSATKSPFKIVVNFNTKTIEITTVNNINASGAGYRNIRHALICYSTLTNIKLGLIKGTGTGSTCTGYYSIKYSR